ncbi:uncharacterized protein HaLaN_04052 [Haematococcus lacustris]|uniref:Uncharacterized protein n=1 Tax=Haematococcus lacustris TaxID=44745 RepID=A0A699YPX8_HAELA|nr:uncharacterized protein HaLaN_04052 [Haematococcus lacustris]
MAPGHVPCLVPPTIHCPQAGGWLGRVYLKEFGTSGVDRFVSLGSPHQAPPTVGRMRLGLSTPGVTVLRALPLPYHAVQALPVNSPGATRLGLVMQCRLPT